ncbi:MAG: hypothetical protein V1861_03190 [Candidatus Micrarchaeota archaeon]
MRLRRSGEEGAVEEKAPVRRGWGRPIAECLAALTLFGTVSCVHTQERLYDPPRGSIAIYSLEDGIRPERVAIGNEINVIAHADVRVVRDGKQMSLQDVEATYGDSGLTYCWFIFQDIGVGSDSNPVYFLLNPKYKEYNEPRYIGAAVFRVDAKGNDYALVVPVKHDDAALQDTGWSIGPKIRTRSDFLFRLHPNTLIPLLDAKAIYRMPDYCKETALPEIAVVEFGRTIPVLVVYPDRE